MDFTELSVGEFEKEFKKFLSKYNSNEIVDMLVECSNIPLNYTYNAKKNVINSTSEHYDILLNVKFSTDLYQNNINSMNNLMIANYENKYKDDCEWGLAS